MIPTIEIRGVELVPYWQQYVSIDKRVTAKGELLMRPQTDEKTEEFFSQLDLDNQFLLLDWQVTLQRAITAHTGAQVSINVHNSLVESDEARERFLDIVRQASGPTTFEFTETYPMPPVTASNRLLQALRTLGHASALDDFGTGLNGLSLLTDYDFDIIKLDRSLIFDLPSRVEKQKTLRLMHEMLQVLGKEHVVEGVETEEVYVILKELGFTTFQGFLFGTPVPVEATLTASEREAST